MYNFLVATSFHYFSKTRTRKINMFYFTLVIHTEQAKHNIKLLQDNPWASPEIPCKLRVQIMHYSSYHGNVWCVRVCNYIMMCDITMSIWQLCIFQVHCLFILVYRSQLCAWTIVYRCCVWPEGFLYPKKFSTEFIYGILLSDAVLFRPSSLYVE